MSISHFTQVDFSSRLSELDAERMGTFLAIAADSSLVSWEQVMADALAEALSEWEAPGTRFGDLRILEDAGADEEQRLAAVERTSERIDWSPRNPLVRRLLRAQADAEGLSVPTVIRNELRQAILLVMGEAGREQRHRFYGQMFTIVPRNESLHEYWQWVVVEAGKAAEGSVLGKPYPAVGKDAMERKDSQGRSLVGPLAAEIPDPLTDPAILLDQMGARQKLSALLRRLSPRERTIACLLAHERPAEAIAAHFNMTRNAADQAIHRLRKKIRQME